MSKFSKIRIQNFGPITNNDWIDINKVTIFIGDQGSGKSSFAKLISTFMWIEKALVRGDFSEKGLLSRSFSKRFLSYHRLESYLKKDSLLEYDGKYFALRVQNDRVIAEKKGDQTYLLPQIIYIPAERNFLSYVKNPNELKLSSESLQDFISVFNESKKYIAQKKISLPFGDMSIEYDRLNDLINIVGNNYKVKLFESSSGLQSVTPLYIVSNYLANSLDDPNSDLQKMNENQRQDFITDLKNMLNNDGLTISDEQRRLFISVLTSRFNKNAFVNIVEEPEQNLFPNSQFLLLSELLRLNNLRKDNQLVITTHSPYIVSKLNVSMYANNLKERINDRKLLSYLDGVVAIDTQTSPDYVSVYQIDKNGMLKEVDKVYSVFSDDNYLNNQLGYGNELLDKLLEIEQSL